MEQVSILTAYYEKRQRKTELLATEVIWSDLFIS